MTQPSLIEECGWAILLVAAATLAWAVLATARTRQHRSIRKTRRAAARRQPKEKA